MRISSTGNVGIGIATPTSLLHALGSQPTAVGTTPGTAATSALNITGGIGGNTTIATTGVGGIGAALSLTGGAGGTAASAVTASTGGAGGALTVTGGVGGAAAVGTGTNIGGVGGNITINPGAGGAASGGSVNTAGASGNVLLATSGGNVGIGTPSPARLFHVYNPTGAFIQLSEGHRSSFEQRDVFTAGRSGNLFNQSRNGRVKYWN